MPNGDAVTNPGYVVPVFSNDMRDCVPGVGGDWATGWRNAHIPNANTACGICGSTTGCQHRLRADGHAIDGPFSIAMTANPAWPSRPYVGDVQQCLKCWRYYPLGQTHECVPYLGDPGMLLPNEALHPIRLGWQCPRCSRILSPDVKMCDCETCPE